jgi:hypothetical protein
MTAAAGKDKANGDDPAGGPTRVNNFIRRKSARIAAGK